MNDYKHIFKLVGSCCSSCKFYGVYCVNPLYSDRQTNVNSVDPVQTVRSGSPGQSLHCVPLTQQFSDKSMNCKIDIFKF